MEITRGGIREKGALRGNGVGLEIGGNSMEGGGRTCGAV